MPHILLAGTVASPPKSEPFPPTGNPYACVIVDAENVEYRIVVHDDQMPDVESLQKGDTVSIQGDLKLVTDKGKLAELLIVAKQILPLRARSKNFLPVKASVQMANRRYGGPEL